MERRLTSRVISTFLAAIVGRCFAQTHVLQQPMLPVLPPARAIASPQDLVNLANNLLSDPLTVTPSFATSALNGSSLCPDTQAFDELRKSLPDDNADNHFESAFADIWKWDGNGTKGLLTFGGNGRELLEWLLRKRAAERPNEAVVLLEVGVWLGVSAARWLNVDPHVRVVGVDPFNAPHRGSPQLSTLQDSLPEVYNQFGNPSFNRALSEYVVLKDTKKTPDAACYEGDPRHRVAMIAGYAPQAFNPIIDAGFGIDIVYLDGGKNHDIVQFTTLFYSMLDSAWPIMTLAISGDDFSHPYTPTIQPILREFAASKGLQLAVSVKRTWVMASSTVGIGLYCQDALKYANGACPFKWILQDPQAYKGPNRDQIFEAAKEAELQRIKLSPEMLNPELSKEAKAANPHLQLNIQLQQHLMPDGAFDVGFVFSNTLTGVPPSALV